MILTGFLFVVGIGYSIGQRRSHRELDDPHGPPSKRSKGNDGRGRGLYGDPVRIRVFPSSFHLLTVFLSPFSSFLPLLPDVFLHLKIPLSQLSTLLQQPQR